VKNLTIARRYAKALLIIGKEDGQAEAYGKELDGFAKLMVKEKALEQAICNPLYGASGRKNVLEAVIGKVGISKIVASFLLLLFDKGRFDFIGDINEFYQKLADELKGVLRASFV
jgi:F-type H+-transporting ATPase subunit delta